TSAGTGVTPPHRPVTASSAAACAAAACPATWRNASLTRPGWLSAAVSRRLACSCLAADSTSARDAPVPARRSDFFLLAFPMGTKPSKDGHHPEPASTLNPQVRGPVLWRRASDDLGFTFGRLVHPSARMRPAVTSRAAVS